MFTGDLHFGHNYQVKREKNGNTNINTEFGYEHPFAFLNQFIEKADYVVANLESPVTDLAQSDFESNKTYLHKEPVRQISEFFASKKIDAVSLANNHFVDYGVQGMEDSFTFFDSQSISHFGAGRNRTEAQDPHIIDIEIGKLRYKISVIGAFEYRKNYDKKYESYAAKEKAGVNRLSEKNLEAQIKKFRKKNPQGKVILYPHWGNNYEWASVKQKEFASKALELGTDLIIGHGAHMMQEIGLIDQKISIFSLGNFVFNTPGRYNQNEVKPFSQLLFLSFFEEEDTLRIEARLYPTFCNNRKSNYQPRPLSEKEFNEEYFPVLENFTPTLRSFAKLDRDELGYFLRFALDDQWNIVPGDEEER